MKQVLLGLVFLAISPFSLHSQEVRLQVVATTTFLADMGQNIAGEYADVNSLMPTGGDPHIYDPIPGDAKKVAEADVILKNGLTLEGWLDELIENSGTKARVATLTKGVSPIKSAVYQDASDPHAWMDVQNALIYLDNILDVLIAADPKNEAGYRKNHSTYKDQLLALDAFIREEIQKIPADRRVLVTSHDAFRYYGNAYGLRVESAMGTSTDAEPTIADITNLRKQVAKYGIPAIFLESTINPKLIRQLANDLGIVVGGELFADSLGDEESEADTYLKMLKRNTLLIVAGLAGENGTKQAEEDYGFIFVILGIFALAFAVVVFKLQIPSRTNLSWKEYTIDVKGLSVSYHRKSVLSNINLSLEPGHVYGLLGGNGSGKSTLFKSILGLIPIDTGEIRIHGEEIEDVQKYISYIPQKEEIDWSFPATVFDIVLMGRYPHRKVFDRLTSTDKAKAREALRQLGIEDLSGKQIGELSGGQQQRTFIARALCQDAEIYLFDEPFVGVDITTESKIIEIVKELAAKGKMVVIIHHDLAKVKEYFGRIIMINQRLIALGETEDVFTDDNIKQTYGGRLTILQATENQGKGYI